MCNTLWNISGPRFLYSQNHDRLCHLPFCDDSRLSRQQQQIFELMSTLLLTAIPPMLFTALNASNLAADNNILVKPVIHLRLDSTNIGDMLGTRFYLRQLVITFVVQLIRLVICRFQLLRKFSTNVIFFEREGSPITSGNLIQNIKTLIG